MCTKLKLKDYLKHPLFWIIVLALVLRWWGADHGMPFVYDIDEPALVRSTTGLRFDPNPHHFDWPHLHFYLNYFVSFVLFYGFRGLLQILHLKDTVENILPILWRDPAIFYLLARLFNGFLGALTVIPVFLTGKKLLGRKLGLVAALLLALFPYHVRQSHMALIDIPATFWVAWALYFSSKVLTSSKLSNYLWTGVFVGLAGSTKYNGAFVALVLPIAHFARLLNIGSKQLSLFDGGKNNPSSIIKLSVTKLFEGFGKLVLAGVASVVAFFAGTPYALLDWKTFMGKDDPTGAMWQFTNVGSVPLEKYWFQVYDAFWLKMVNNLGVVLTVVFLIALVLMLVRRWSTRSFFLAPFIVFYFLLTARGTRNPSHYYLIVYPSIALLVGDSVLRILQKLQAVFKGKALTMGLFLILLNPLAIIVGDNILFSRLDTRQLVDTWVTQNVDKTQPILIVGDPALGLSKDNLVKKYINFGQLHDMREDENVNTLDRFSVVVMVGKQVELPEQFVVTKEIFPQNQRGPKVWIYQTGCVEGSAESCIVELTLDQ